MSSKTKTFITFSPHKIKSKSILIISTENEYKVKDLNIKNRTYYFVNDFIYTENFDLSNIKIDEKSYENILIYYIGYVIIKEYVKTYSVNPLYLIFQYVNG